MCAEGHGNVRWGKIEYTESDLGFLNEKQEKKMVSTQTDWNAIIAGVGRNNLEAFANGSLSARDLYNLVTYTSYAGPVRSLLREHGSTYARRLARKALSRR